MGTGNYRHADGATVMIDLYDGIYEEAKGDDDLASILSQEAFSDFQANVTSALSNTSFAVDGKNWRRDDRDCLILAENGHFQIWSHEDSYGHVFVTYGLREGLDDSAEPLARHHLSARAEAFFDKLEEAYPLNVATSAWTSASRRPVAAAA